MDAGAVQGGVRLLLRAEGAALLVFAVLAYAQLAHDQWGRFAALLLLPDLAMLGYLAGPAIGARAYNAAHSVVGPVLLAAAGFALPTQAAMLWPLAAIWLAHVGLDRLLGYGLKYGRGFGHTHLGRLGPRDPCDGRQRNARDGGARDAPGHNPAMSTDAPRILLIDDDVHLGPPLASYFARFGCTLDCALRPSEGLARLRAHPYDAAILDVMLPEMDGFALCRQIRTDSDIPIVMLTARGDVMDRVVGLELGADDYLPKPFEPRELVARVQTILRRQRVRPAAAPASAQRHDFDGLAIDLDRREVLRHGERLELTGTEFELLALLASEPGKVFSRDDILNRLRGHEADLFTRAVDIVVSRLRRKLEPLDCIKTLRNAGYTLAVGRVVEEAGSTPARPPVRPEPDEGQNGAQATADRPPGAGS